MVKTHVRTSEIIHDGQIHRGVPSVGSITPGKHRNQQRSTTGEVGACVCAQQGAVTTEYLIQVHERTDVTVKPVLSQRFNKDDEEKRTSTQLQLSSHSQIPDIWTR